MPGSAKRAGLEVKSCQPGAGCGGHVAGRAGNDQSLSLKGQRQARTMSQQRGKRLGGSGCVLRTGRSLRFRRRGRGRLRGFFCSVPVFIRHGRGSHGLNRSLQAAGYKKGLDSSFAGRVFTRGKVCFHAHFKTAARGVGHKQGRMALAGGSQHHAEAAALAACREARFNICPEECIVGKRRGSGGGMGRDSALCIFCLCTCRACTCWASSCLVRACMACIAVPCVCLSVPGSGFILRDRRSSPLPAACGNGGGGVGLLMLPGGVRVFAGFLPGMFLFFFATGRKSRAEQ